MRYNKHLRSGKRRPTDSHLFCYFQRVFILTTYAVKKSYNEDTLSWLRVKKNFTSFPKDNFVKLRLQRSHIIMTIINYQ